MPQTNRIVLEALLGLLSHLVENNKPFDIYKFACAIGQTTALVETGLEWIHHHGDYDLSLLSTKNKVSPGPGYPLPAFKGVDKKFNLLLHEISSFRTYFRNAHQEYLI